MKKSIKKIAAAVSAAVLCALPMANALSANAAYAGQKKTFRTYITINASKIKLYEFEYDRVFKTGYKNSITFKGYSPKIAGGVGFDHTVPQVGRSCLFIDSESLSHFNGIAATEVYDSSDFSVSVSNFKSTFTRTIWGFGNYLKGDWTWFEDLDKDVTEEIVFVGDANRDNTIDVRDAVVIAQYAANNFANIDNNIAGGRNYVRKAGDVDGNGVVNTYDTDLVLNYIVGNIDSFGDKQVNLRK